MGDNHKQENIVKAKKLVKDLTSILDAVYKASWNCNSATLRNYLKNVRDRVQSSLMYAQLGDIELAEAYFEKYKPILEI